MLTLLDDRIASGAVLIFDEVCTRPACHPCAKLKHMHSAQIATVLTPWACTQSSCTATDSP